MDFKLSNISIDSKKDYRYDKTAKRYILDMTTIIFF